MHVAIAIALLFAATPSPDGAPPTADIPAPIAKRMREIILPRVEFEDAGLGEVIEYIRMKTIANDRRKGDGRDGINFMLLTPPPKGGGAEPPPDIPKVTLSLKGASLHEATISLRLKKIPMIEALDIVCAGCERHWHLAEDGTIIIVPR